MSNDCNICKHEAKLICNCVGVYLCEQCIGQHLLKNSAIKHRPMRIMDADSESQSLFKEQPTKPDIKSAINSKLSNEVLELEEFRKISLQKISEMLQLAEKELLETVEKMMNLVADECDNTQRELKNAIALLRLPEPPSNSILDMFESCNSVGDVRDLNILFKDLDLVYPNMKEVIRSSIIFSLQLTKTPKKLKKLEVPNRGRSFSSLGHLSSNLSENNHEPENKKIKSTLSRQSPKPKKIITRSVTPKKPFKLENIEMESKNIQDYNPPTPLSPGSLSTSSPLIFPYIAYFYPTTNKFAIYNTIEASLKIIELPNKIFLQNSS